MRATRWTGYLLLPIAFLLERSAWFAVRSVLWEHLAGDGASEADVASQLVRSVSWLVVLSPLAGAAVGYALGARRTLLIGLLSLCAGYLLLLEGSAAWPAAIVVALGLGLARPAFLAVAGAVSPDPAETPRSTLFLLLYAMTTVAALGGPGIATNVRPQDLVWVIGGAALLAAIAAAVTGIHLAVARAQGALELEALDSARPIAGAAVLLAWLFLAVAVLRLGAALLLQSRMASQFPTYVHPLMVIAVILMVGLVWIGLSAGGARVPAVNVAAIGLIALSLAPFPIGLALADLGWNQRDIQGFAHLGGTLVLAGGEALVMAFLLSRICASAPARFSVAFAAAWLLATSLTSAVLGLVPESIVVQGIGLVLASMTCLVAGIVLLVRRKRLRTLFEGA